MKYSEIEILSIEEIEEEVDVYDIEVEDDHSFISNGIICHNCQICMSLDGKVYKYKNGVTDAPNLPIHVRCFIDPQIPIYTSEGMKQIGKIEVGDKVLTHKGRYKKVTELIRSKEYDVPVVKIYAEYPKFNSNKNFKPTIKKLTLTEEHPLMINGEWKLANNIKIGDKIKYLATEYKFIELKIVKIKKWKVEKRSYSKLTEEDVIEIRRLYDNRIKNVKQITENYNVAYPTIWNICKGKSWKDGKPNKKPTTLYNFSVEDDESYIAKGFVSHNCRCFYSPVTWSWQELAKREKVKYTNNQKDKFTSKLADTLTYEQWLKKLEKSTDPLERAMPKEILGPKRYELWKNGKIKFTQMATDNKILNINELEALAKKRLKKVKKVVKK